MKIYGLVGYPLGHSFSRKYFTEKFSKEKIEAEYLNFELESIGKLPGLLQQYPQLQGFNVTIPYKQKVIPFLSELSPEAKAIGAVNCVKIHRESSKVSLIGHNTDAIGFCNSLTSFIPSSINRALILGNGGAAKAVRYVLELSGIDTLTVSRTPQKKKEIGYQEVSACLNSYLLLVNTTPLGTWPHITTCPDLPYELITPAHYLFDLVYNPEITEFLKRGASQGAHIRNGLEMLQGQAEAGWEIWCKA